VAIIWRARDRPGREVVLTDVGRAHVLERRATMAGREADVKAAIEQADFIVHDADHADRQNHYRRGSG